MTHLKPIAEIVLIVGDRGINAYWSSSVEPEFKHLFREEFDQYGRVHKNVNDGEYDSFIISPLYILEDALRRLIDLCEINNFSVVITEDTRQ